MGVKKIKLPVDRDAALEVLQTTIVEYCRSHDRYLEGAHGGGMPNASYPQMKETLWGIARGLGYRKVQKEVRRP